MGLPMTVSLDRAAALQLDRLTMAEERLGDEVRAQAKEAARIAGALEKIAGALTGELEAEIQRQLDELVERLHQRNAATAELVRGQLAAVRGGPPDVAPTAAVPHP